MEKILIPTLRFPPAGGVGLRRLLKIAKYLARFGVKVHFLTTENGRQVNNYEDDVRGDNMTVRKLPSLSLSNLLNTTPRTLLGKLARTAVYYLTLPLFFVDYATLWGLVMVPYAVRYLRKHKVEYLYISGPPFSTLWHGALIKKWLGDDICFIAEWRDVWLEDEARVFLWPKPLFRWIQRTMERQVLQAADIVLTVTADLGQALAAKSGHQAKVVVLENGFDEEELQAAQSVGGEGRDDSGVIRIVYTGNIVRTREEGFMLLLQAVSAMAAAGLPVVFEVMGTLSYLIVQAVRRQHAEMISLRQLILYGLDTPAAAIALLNRADYGVVIVQRDHPEALTSKFFEYCAAGKTIIGIGPDGELRRKMSAAGLGLFVCLDDETAVAQLVDYIGSRRQAPADRFEAIRANNSFSGIAAKFMQFAEASRACRP